MTKYAKAILSAIIAVIGGLITSYTSANNQFTTVGILTAVNLGLVSLVGVFMVPNKADPQSTLTEAEVTGLVDAAIANHPLMAQLQTFLDSQAKSVVPHS